MMTEETLEALTQLFALTTMQDGGTSEAEKQFVVNYFNKVLDQASVGAYIERYQATSSELENKFGSDPNATEEMKDKAFQKFSVRMLGMCRKIKKTLKDDEKVFVLMKMLDLVSTDMRTTQSRMAVIKTAAAELEVSEYYDTLHGFVLKEPSELLYNKNVLTISSSFVPNIEGVKHISVEALDGKIIILRVPIENSPDLYFVKYTGQEIVKLNDFPMQQDEVYPYDRGSIIRTQQGNSFYYSDLTSTFLEGYQKQKLSFNALNIEYKFKNGTLGLRDVSVAEGAGKLIGIMGASGAGKTTLLNVLAGIETPSKGAVVINGIDIHKDKDKAEGIIGYVAQDDLLIEELTVYQNLYYNTKLCFKGLSEEELDRRVIKTLSDLGLEHIKDLRVGNVLSKTISGGQRKRVNIALELIREPAVLFLDEPTSGLSSRDSENVMDLLKELSVKGKLIFVVIHQPSSDIFKMFDKLVLLDTGGYQIYYGNPVDAVVYFKKETNQVKAEQGQCSSCGNVNPEQIFDIIEDRDLTGKNIRKRQPYQWNEIFLKRHSIEPIPTEVEQPPKALDLPNRFKQTVVFTTRDFLAKISNTQYVSINLLEAPLLAFLLSYIIRFQNGPGGKYIFYENDNIPAYILISVLVALFMGLTVSAEEIIKDRKIRKREAFLNLSRHAYFFSKLIILFTLSAIQTLCFVLVGNFVLDVQGANITYWLVLFSVSCFANVLGLNISSSFNSVVTVYITIPLLLIPQMILSGIIFNFNSLNSVISDKGKVPIVADLMVSRWGFEAIAVDQFKNNKYQKPYYNFDKERSIADYRRSFWLDEMKNILVRALNRRKSINDNDSIRNLYIQDLTLLQIEIIRERQIEASRVRKGLRPALERFEGLQQKITLQNFNEKVAQELEEYYDSLNVYYRERFNKASKEKEYLMDELSSRQLDEYRQRYHNKGLKELMEASNMSKKVIEYKGRLLQQVDPVFHDPLEYSHAFDYRTHFLAPRKYLFGKYYDTYYFNILVIWLMSFVLYIALYFNLIRKGFASLGHIFGKVAAVLGFPFRQLRKLKIKKKTKESKEEEKKLQTA